MTAAETVGKQLSKSEKAQASICKSTLNCLVEFGYAKTSLNLVAVRAGYSKGALQHHFPSKQDLIIATAKRLIEPPIRSHLDTLKSIKTVSDAIWYSWDKLVNTAAYHALQEILSASRTDLALQKRISPTIQEWHKMLDEQAILSYRAPGGDEEVKQLINMTRSFFRGLFIDESYDSDPSESLKQINKWITLLEPKLALRDGKKHP